MRAPLVFTLALSMCPLLALAQTQPQPAAAPAQQLATAAPASDDMLQQMRGLMTQNCVQTAREKSTAAISDAHVQAYCSCVSERLVTDQASLIKLGELGLRMMRKEPGAQKAVAQMAGPAATLCATKLQDP